MKFIRSFLLSLIALPLACTAAASRPNFVVILVDNIGKDWFGCYGADGGQSPEIDRLAAGGVRFRNCYVTPLCSNTRVQFLTGRHSFSTGWHTHHDAGIYGGGGLLSLREKTWAAALRDAGYATCLAGKWQIDDLYVHGDALKRHGFDEHLAWTGALAGKGTGEERWKASLDPAGSREMESRYWDPVSFRNGKIETLAGKFGPDVYLDFLLDFISRHRDGPFVAYYACPFVHIPTVPTSLTPRKDAPEREQFVGMVRSMDAQVGRLVAELERLRLRDNTIIVFMSDNGTPAKLSGSIGGRKAAGGLGTLSENGINVPFIVNCPALIPGGRVSDVLADCSDVFPTLIDFAGMKADGVRKLDGVSLVPELSGKAPGFRPREQVFAEYAAERVAFDGRFKLYSDGRFFDLNADPLEKANIAASDDALSAKSRERLRAALAGLPPGPDVGFEFRSMSAFKLRGDRDKTRPGK